MLALPIVTAMALVGPGMVSRAAGCSGAAQQPEPGWNGLYGVDQPDTPTSGVYVLRGQLLNVSDQQALDALTVSVQDAAGKVVPGSLALHLVSEAGSSRDVVVTWKPDAPFSPSQKYSVAWSVVDSPNDDGNATLTTVTDPKPPADPTLSVEKLSRKWQLEGELLSCSKTPYSSQFDHNSCSYQTTGTPPFGSEETLLTQVVFRLAPPGPKPALTWITRVEPVPGKGELVTPESAIFFSSAMTPGVAYPSLEFRGEASEYCAKFVTEDLADGSTHSEQVCAPLGEPPDPGPSLLENALVPCDSPPTPELEAAWCKSHADDEQCGGGSGCSLAAPRSGAASELAGVVLLLTGLVLRGRARASRSKPRNA